MKLTVKSLNECIKIDNCLEGISVETFKRELADKTFSGDFKMEDNCYHINGWWVPRYFCEDRYEFSEFHEDIFAEFLIVSGELYK